MSAALDRKPTRSRPQTLPDPADLEGIIERLNIGTLRKDQLRARKSIVVDDDTPPLSHHEIEALERSETFSVTSEESYNDRKLARKKMSGSSKDSGTSSLGVDLNPKPSKSIVSKDQEVQTSIGKSFSHNRLQDVYAAEEGALAHSKPAEETSHKSTKLSKIFKFGKKASADSTSESQVTLPQSFIVKYMGSRPSKGYGGAKYIQTPVEEVVEAVSHMSKGSDLPLVRLEVAVEGLHMSPHKRNKVKNFESVSIPLQYISYGSQDQNYPRIFCFIMVKEMSARSKKLDCHVYACDSSKNARKVAGCLALAFQIYQDKTQGQPAQYAAQIGPGSTLTDDDIKSSYDA